MLVISDGFFEFAVYINFQFQGVVGGVERAISIVSAHDRVCRGRAAIVGIERYQSKGGRIVADIQLRPDNDVARFVLNDIVELFHQAFPIENQE